MPPQASETGEYSTQAESAYWRIREDIVFGNLKPNEKLSLDRLREKYRFGASPLREALSRLAAENLVRILGQRGFWVAPISEDEFIDITETRLHIEPEALSRSIAHATLAWEGQVVASYHRLSTIERQLDSRRDEVKAAWNHENQDFHLMLISNCQSPWLLRIASMLFEQSKRYRHQAVELEAVPQAVLQREHQALFDAALGRNAGLACELLKTHIRSTAESLRRILFPAETVALEGRGQRKAYDEKPAIAKRPSRGGRTARSGAL